MPVLITPDYELFQLLQTIATKVDLMSQTLSQQIDAVTAGLRADMEDIAAKIDTILTSMPPGSQVTQEQVDALAAIKTGLDAVAAKVDAATAPPAP